ncbi:hypothetical protein AVEN_154001-1 [Araneus ventricosus]|uniref:Uncharacterized protein n=1 Tax=Araneus ventricosus TaxID=182803 RepID=A0A4Y2PBP3_ARAVE|nr:hypothetical protein AVEN_154001-1 [Araneus ventricosus]
MFTLPRELLMQINANGFCTCASDKSVLRDFEPCCKYLIAGLMKLIENVGSADLDDVPQLPWPPRSPDLTPCDFFLWCYVKYKIYVPSNPTTLQALMERITAAVMDAIERLDGTG